MAKRNSKGRERVRANKSTNLAGEIVTMTDHGHEVTSRAGAQVANAVHAPQLMNLSSQIMAPRRGTRELLAIYTESPWLRAIVNKIARAVADTDWMLFAKKNARGRYIDPDSLIGKSGIVREDLLKRDLELGAVDTIDSHPMLDLLANGTGNPRLRGHAAIQVTQSHMDLTGEAFWLLEPNSLGVPVAFWPLPPSWINNFPTYENPYYELNAPGGVQVKIPTTMIVPFIDPDPANPYGRGTGISKSLDDEIQLDEYAAKHQKAFFLNRARPDIIISGQFVSPKDAERLEKQWKSDHQGFWRAFKPLFFSQKIDVKELSQTFESMQMVQIRKHERDTFVSVFGAPPEKFGIIGESKRSTINAADYFWNKDLIKPRVEMIRRMLQDVLIPRFDDRLLLYYDTPVIQDDEFKLNAMKQAPYSATINEWRKVYGAESLGPAGDVLVINQNQMMIPVKKGAKAATAEEVVEESIRQKQARAGIPDAPEFDTRSIVDEITFEVVKTLEDTLGNLGTGLKGMRSLAERE